MRELEGYDLFSIRLMRFQLILQRAEGNRIIHFAYVPLEGLGVDPMTDPELIAELLGFDQIILHALYRSRAILECANIYLLRAF